MVNIMKRRTFPEHNYRGIYFNGKTLRIALDPSKPITELKYPEFYDVKITDECHGKCSYCYMDSTCDTEPYKNVIEKIKDFFGNMSQNEKPFQVACLGKNEYIYTENGAVEIKDILVGDSVYDDRGNLVKVINKIKSKKDTYVIKGNKGFQVIATSDHQFLMENGLVKVDNLKIGDNFLVSDYKNYKYCTRQLDLSLFINKSSKIKNKRGGSSGGIIMKNEVAFMHTLSKIPRYLNLNEDIMWLYGLSVAEGSKRGISLHIDEIYYAKRALKIYEDITGLGECGSSIITYPEKNAQQVYFKESKTYRTIFFEAMKIGYGARDKSISFLFGLDKNLIRSALVGMFDGDGCYRKRFEKRTNKYNFSLSYKTTSKKLANELVYLLSSVFGIKSYIYHGESPERLLDTRLLKKSDYFMVDIYGKENILKLFPKKFQNDNDFKLSGTFKYSKRKTDNFIKIESIKPHTEDEVYDITLEDNSTHLFTISHGVISHNCGGGEPTESSDFLEILKTFHDLGITPNYTTNGMFMDLDIDYITAIIDSTKKYCGGVAVSCHPHLDEYWKMAANVFHENDIKLNFHIIISDKESSDRFRDIYDEWKDMVDYFVLLPYGSQGRAEAKEIDWEYLLTIAPENTNKIAFGANFHPYLTNDPGTFNVSLYEPESLSKFLDLKDMKLYPSSFSLDQEIII